MTGDFVLIVLLLIFEAVVWLIPALRKRNGNWLIALKTVPVGIIVLIASSALLAWFFRMPDELQPGKFSCPRWLALVLPLASALAVITVCGWGIHRFFKVQRRHNPLPSLGLFLFFLPGTALASLVLSFICMMNDGNYRSEWRIYWLELGTKEMIAFEEQSIHPFLAEYNYRLCIVRNGETFRRRLFTNCGGRTHFNIYRLQDGRFLFRDKDWDYVVDVSKQELWRLVKFGGKLYMAAVPNEKVDFWAGPYREHGKVYVNTGKHKTPAEEVTTILDNMKYIGCIKDRFYPAKQQPETAIKFMQQRR